MVVIKAVESFVKTTEFKRQVNL